MARPRVFISSTFYDLRQVREDLERFVRELGYEPVRHEAGVIPYEKGEPLETSAFREVELADVIVCVIGGRFGTESRDDPGHSVTQAELRRALEHGLQVFIFVEKSVLAEYSTFQLNKDSTSTKYRFVDDVRVYEFLEQVFALPKNNPIAPFETAVDITAYLREQWAGLFQRSLQQHKRLAEVVPSRRVARANADGDASTQLRFYFRRNGYVRYQLPHRVEDEGSRRYKKGDEVRLVANSAAELAVIRRLLVAPGFRPGRPFAKGRQHRQPIYGREAVAQFLALVGHRKAMDRDPTG